jgi:hypothetical protein
MFCKHLLNKEGIKMNTMRVKQILQQFFIAVVIFSLFCPGNLWAKRKGAQLKIMKSDSKVIEGELLRVKDNSLLVMTTGSVTGVTVDMNEIIQLRIKKKRTFGKGAMPGLLIGAGLGIAVGLAGSYDGEGFIRSRGEGALVSGLTLGVLGLGVGGITGSFGGHYYKKIQVKGKSPYKIKKIMLKLKEMARFKN